MPKLAPKPVRQGYNHIHLPIYGLEIPQTRGAALHTRVYTPFSAQPGENWWPIKVCYRAIQP